MGAPPAPPPLPPRDSTQPRPASVASSSDSHRTPPPGYEEATATGPGTGSAGASGTGAGTGTGAGAGADLGTLPGLGFAHFSGDPRTSSTQSLVPSLHDAEGKRTLLVVYIHGFYGNDQSFRSFPAHVHSLLQALLSNSHIIHSKIYPRYKTYKAIELATDKFSSWLEPHESPTTDVILIGHSMGGLLAADVVLKPNHNPHTQQPLKHRILGTVSLDSPFLGLHPGIVVSGISSLFQPAPKPQDESPMGTPGAASSSSSLYPTNSLESQVQSPSSTSSFATPPGRQSSDPYFDPPFYNDDPFREQPLVKRLMNFASKHKAEGIFHAVGNHLLSHLEYGGCLADYPALLARYKKIRALEDVDELQALANEHVSGTRPRVRFVNYYTLSSGRPKLPKDSPSTTNMPSQTDLSNVSTTNLDSQSLLSVQDRDTLQPPSDASTPRISIEDPDGKMQNEAESPPDLSRLSLQDMEPLPMEDIDPTPMEDSTEHSGGPEEANIESLSQSESIPQSQPDVALPPIPEAPVQPTLPDLEQYTDKDARKQAEKESKRLQKAYDQAVKDRTKALREREKLLEKRRKKTQKDAEKLEKDAQKEQRKLEKAEKKRQVREDLTLKETDDVRRQVEGGAAAKDDQPKKLKKFCTLPSKINGKMDPTWVDIYMDGVDEVGAHCGLFFVGPHYELLIGDVGNRVLGWVREDISKRTLLELD